jgi:hypothetical protein
MRRLSGRTQFANLSGEKAPNFFIFHQDIHELVCFRSFILQLQATFASKTIPQPGLNWSSEVMSFEHRGHLVNVIAAPDLEILPYPHIAVVLVVFPPNR